MKSDFHFLMCHCFFIGLGLAAVLVGKLGGVFALIWSGSFATYHYMQIKNTFWVKMTDKQVDKLWEIMQDPQYK